LIFKYSELRDFLHRAKSKYRITSLKRYSGRASIILRHDVDFDLKAARMLASLEKECGVDSTFFVMTTSLTYNPCSQPARTYLKEIADMGFEVGLHFYPQVYDGEANLRLRRRVDEEAGILRSITGKKVESVSIHNPSIRNSYPLFKGYRNAYDPGVFSQENYISDSTMLFRKDIRSFVERAERETIQILLHPMYYTEDGKRIDSIFYEYACDFLRQIDETYKVNKTYLSEVKPDLTTLVAKRVLEEKGIEHLRG
jgi:hypothetical protein